MEKHFGCWEYLLTEGQFAVLQSCKDDKAGMWLQADYPNYPGPSGKTIVETAYDENLRKSGRIL